MRRHLPAATAIVFLVLCLTSDERTFGVISDEQQMLSTSVSMAQFGELGIARAQLFQVSRPGGDAVAPYGLGQPLVEMPGVLLASLWERTFGPRSSQTLFVLIEILLVTLAASGAGLLARSAGASAAGQVVAILGTALGSPLWAYTGRGYSEPLQAMALVVAAVMAARAARRKNGRALALAAAAGFFAGFAVLTKSVNVVAAPFTLAPLVLDRNESGSPVEDTRRRLRLFGGAALGAVLPTGCWLAGDLARFGRPFGAYGPGSFSHPFFDGLWRLLAGPNKGLLLYFPLLLLSISGLFALARDLRTRGTAVAVSGVFFALLFVSASWWWWDGTVGWGPRFLVPAIPLLAAAAGRAIVAGTKFRAFAVILLVSGAGVNLLGVVQNEAVSLYLLEKNPVLPSAEEEKRIPLAELRGRASNGALPRTLFAGENAVFSPILLHAFLLSTRSSFRDTADLAERLGNPPWQAQFPGPSPGMGAPRGSQAYVAEAYLRSRPALPHLGEAVAARHDGRTDEFNGAWLVAVGDQAARALDVGHADRAQILAARLIAVTPTPAVAALYAESLRLGGKGDAAEEFIVSLPDETRASAPVSLVRALLSRDDGQEAIARSYLARARHLSPRVSRAASEPLSKWPSSYRAMLTDSSERVRR